MQIHFPIVRCATFMFHIFPIKSVVFKMSMLSIFVIILLLNNVKSDTKWEHPGNITSSMNSFKEYVSKMIKEQSFKIQTLLKKIQTNAMTVLDKIKNGNQSTSKAKSKYLSRKVNLFDETRSFEQNQIEAPVVETSKNELSTEVSSRSFNAHYGPSGFGASASGYGAPTFHHHSIGFDPINIVVSVSLLSFLLQALQGLLTRTRLPTPIVEARELDSISSRDWLNHIDTNKPDKSKYKKKRFLKKYLTSY